MKKIIFVISALFIFEFTDAQTIWVNLTKYRGFIGKYEIAMTLANPYGGATNCFTIGEYYYLSTKTKINLCSEDDEVIVERVKGKETGYFILSGDWNKRVGQVVVGEWYTADGNKSYPVTLKVVSKGKY